MLGLDERGSPDYMDFDFRTDCVLVLGREGAGLHDLVKKTCDHLLRIPMAGAVSSLNVSVAGAIVMYEAMRQRPPTARPTAGSRQIQGPQGARILRLPSIFRLSFPKEICVCSPCTPAQLRHLYRSIAVPSRCAMEGPLHFDSLPRPNSSIGASSTASRSPYAPARSRPALLCPWPTGPGSSGTPNRARPSKGQGHLPARREAARTRRRHWRHSRHGPNPATTGESSSLHSDTQTPECSRRRRHPLR